MQVGGPTFHLLPPPPYSLVSSGYSHTLHSHPFYINLQDNFDRELMGGLSGPGSSGTGIGTGAVGGTSMMIGGGSSAAPTLMPPPPPEEAHPLYHYNGLAGPGESEHRGWLDQT